MRAAAHIRGQNPAGRSGAMRPVDLSYLDPVPVETETQLVAHALPGRNRRLVVSLAGVGTRRHGVPPPEFLGTASGYGENHVLLISDPGRSWMNGPGVAGEMVDLIETYRGAHGIEEVVTLGNSMGGFAAIRLAELTRIDTVIAFTPQFSVHPDIVPEETRWRYFRDQIAEWRYADVGALAEPDTAYFLFHGGAEDERWHWLRFPWRRQLNHFILHGMGHRVASVMRKRQILGPVIAAAIERRPRVARRRMEREFLGRRFDVHRRETYQQLYPDLTLAPGGAPVVVPAAEEKTA